jgi:hypothetical protein
MNERYDFCFCSLRFGLGSLGGVVGCGCACCDWGLARLGVLFICRWGGQSGAGEYASTFAPLFLWDIKGNCLLRARERGSVVSWVYKWHEEWNAGWALGSLQNITELFLTPHKQRIEMEASLST